eukprot:NODE_541_length_6250_cov_0.390831.p2 type:complete len:182 gc:universal NODE_541_length_6250_cov_0.390831:6150-5605(-)
MLSKHDGSVRFCFNYKPPISNLQSLINSLDGAKFFISLDLKSGYWQRPLADKDREKTAFVTPFGLFEFIGIPFGLSTAPASFQRLMDEIFKEMIGTEILVYLDAFLIFGHTLESLMKSLGKVLKKLKEFGLTLCAKKCKFGMIKVNFLGFAFSSDGFLLHKKKCPKPQRQPENREIGKLGV